MAESRPGTHLPLERRQAIFRALIEVQDTGLDVPTSRQAIASNFAVTEAAVRDIEREGRTPCGPRCEPGATPYRSPGRRG